MRCYGRSPPTVEPDELGGRLLVIEGPDGVGRSTQIQLLTERLEQQGHAVSHVGLSRSMLAGEALEVAKAGHQMRPRTAALFYAADFFDQMERQMVPALRAGMVVLADRYVQSLMARAIVRGMDAAWLKRIYEGALVPDAVMNLQATPRRLIERQLHKLGQLDYWESGMDLGISTDWHESSLRYQVRLRRVMEGLRDEFPYETVNANRSIRTIQRDLRGRVQRVLETRA